MQPISPNHTLNTKTLLNPPTPSSIHAARLSPPAFTQPILPTEPMANDPVRSHFASSIEQQLTFAPLAWLKLLTLLHADDVEVGGFGISSAQGLLYVTDIAVPLQRVSAVTVAFEDASVAEHFESCADRGISPSRCGRVWVHTHPGSSAVPSSVDEQTFERAFGSSDWAAMVILAKEGRTYCRLRFAAGPGGQIIIPVCVDWAALPQALLDHEGQLDSLTASWLDEYGRNVRPVVYDRLSEALDLLDDHDPFRPRHELYELYDRQERHELNDRYPSHQPPLWPDGPLGGWDDPFPFARAQRDSDEAFLNYLEEELESELDSDAQGFGEAVTEVRS